MQENRKISLISIIGISVMAVFAAYKLTLFMTWGIEKYAAINRFLILLTNLRFDVLSLICNFLFNQAAIVMFTACVCRRYKRKYLPVLLFLSTIAYILIFVYTTSV